MPKARGPRRRVRPELGKRVVAGVAGALCVILGAGLVVTAVIEWDQRAAYRSAPVCAAGGTSGCVRETTGVLLGKDHSSRKGGDVYRLDLAVRDGTAVRTRSVELPAPDHIWPRLHPRDEVTVLLWGGDIAAVEAGGVRAETDDSPYVETIEFLVYGGAALVAGIAALAFALGQQRRSAPVTVPLGVAVFVVFFQSETFDVFDPAALASTFAFVALGVAALAGIRRAVRG
jgi:hypothetical protein